MIYKQGDHIFIPFKKGETLLDRQGYPRTYQSRENYYKYYGECENVELVEYAPVVEAAWVNAAKPGQITCGGNPVYACGNCGDIYGSFELFPSARYCKMCGARLRMPLDF